MGGPCFLLHESTADADSAGGDKRPPYKAGLPRLRRVTGPPATDNFHVAPFEVDGSVGIWDRDMLGIQ